MTLSTDELVVWYYDDKNVTGGYVLLDSDDPMIIDQVQKVLRAADILCRKHGSCFRPANNNKQYKTFIRITKSTGDTPRLDEVRTAIRSLPRSHFDASPYEIRSYVNKLHERIAQLQSEINELKQHDAQRDLLKDEEIQSLRQQLDEIRASQRRQAERGESEELEKMYQAEIASLQKKFDESQAGRLADLDELNKIKAENTKLHRDLQETRRDLEDNRSTRLGRSEEFAQLLGCFLPNLEFIGDSVAFMLTEVRDYSHILRNLCLLNGHQKVPFKAFRGAPGWMEIDKKISDGQSNEARIYYRKQNSEKYLVLVSEKDEQELDKERLRRNS